MTSQDSVYNSLYLTNYAKLNLVDQLSRVPGVGAVNVMGAGDYSMRIWLDPEAMRIRNISPAQVYQSIQSQNMEVSAGYIGQPIGKDNKNAFNIRLMYRDDLLLRSNLEILSFVGNRMGQCFVSKILRE